MGMYEIFLADFLEMVNGDKHKQENSEAKSEMQSVECSTIGCNKKITLENGYAMGAIGKIYCSHCRWVMSQNKLAYEMYSPRDVISETEKAIKMSKLKKTKPHYKWSWKLNKAVRL